MGNSKNYTIKFGMGYDAEIVGKLESVKNKSAYIKDLIRLDIGGKLDKSGEFAAEEAEKVARQYSGIIEEKYKEEFKNNNEKTISFITNTMKDSDIIDKLGLEENKSNYVRQLVLMDMGLINQEGERYLLLDENGNPRSEKRTLSERRKEVQREYNKNVGKEAHREAQRKYREKKGNAKDKEYKSKIKRIPLDVSLDFFETINNHVETTKEPRNIFIKRAINETIERDNNK